MRVYPADRNGVVRRSWIARTWNGKKETRPQLGDVGSFTSALLTHASGRKSALGEELQPGKSVTQGYVEKEAGLLQHAINLVNEAFLVKAGVSPVLHAPVPTKFGNYVVTHFDAKAMLKKLKGPVVNG